MIASLPFRFLASLIDSQYNCFPQIVMVRQAQLIDSHPVTSKI